jgi:hypothetical protein
MQTSCPLDSASVRAEPWRVAVPFARVEVPLPVLDYSAG